jgi:hypothetical protein
MSELILLSNVRLSFPHIAEPQRKTQDDGTEKASYNCEFILTPNNPGWAAFHQAVAKAALEKWGANAQNVIAHCGTDRKKRCYGAGEEKVNGKTFQPYDGYAGMYYITAGSTRQPQIIGPDGNKIDENNTMAVQQMARKLYGGCYVNAAVKPWLQENKHGRGIRCDLVAVQFYADGEAFGEGNVDTSGLFAATPAAAAAPSGVAPAWAVPGAPSGVPGMPGMPAAPFPGAGLAAAPVAPAVPQFAPPAGLPPFLS